MSKQFYTVEHYQSRRSIGYLLRRAGKLITGRIEALFIQEDVSFIQWVILMNLRDGMNTTAAELSQHLCHDSGALTRVLDQMEERDFITRNRRLEDRRVVALELTETGRQAITAFLPRVVQLYNGLLTDFSENEVTMLLELLTRLIANLSESPRKN